MKITKYIIWLNTKVSKFFSDLMKYFLRLNGASIGLESFISISSRLVASKIYIGKDVKILSNVKIKAQEIHIDDGAVISSGTFISGESKIFIGKCSYLGKNSRIDLSRDVYIGNQVGFGENSIIWTHGYFPPADEGYPVTYKSVSINDRAWISTGIIILPGVEIGKEVIIGAGSLITKSIPDRVIVAGNPAKIIKNVDDIINKKSFIEIMEPIIDEFFKYKEVHKEKCKNSNVYETDNTRIILIDFKNVESEEIPIKNKDIVLFKNYTANDISIYELSIWFDFDKKIRKRTKSILAKELHKYLRKYGIRFLLE